MPFIDQKDLIKLYDEIDSLSDKERELRKGYVDLKLENNAIVENQRKKKVLIYLLSALVVCLLFSLFYVQRTKKNIPISTRITSLQKQLDSVVSLNTIYKKETSFTANDGKNVLVYAVQIGVFKDLKIDKNIHKGFKQLENREGLYTYMIGEFQSYEQVKIFKDQVVALGIKDAFIVAHYNGKRIGINKALKISDELEFYDQ